MKQLDLLRSVWWWYLLPFVPGLIAVDVGMVFVHPERKWRIVVIRVLAVVLTLGVYELNRRAAARLQTQLDRLKEHLR